ncbi:MAG: efflux RND transporter periplasmic adaptor subunit [Dehalococcoidia bacterium]
MIKRTLRDALLVMLLVISAASCSQSKKQIQADQMATVTRGDMVISISSDGNLNMPNEVYLKFGLPGTVKEIRVEKGDVVRAGTLLATLDDTTEVLAVKAQQYLVEQAINNVVQNCCGSHYPTFYTLATALMRFEQAQDELKQAGTYLSDNMSYDAASSLTLAKYDLAAARAVYADPKLDTIQTQYNDLQQPMPVFPELKQLTALLDTKIERLDGVQTLLESGDNTGAIVATNALTNDLNDVHTLVKNNSRLPGAYTYPDTSTSLAISRQVLDSLSEIEGMLYSDNPDKVKMSEKLRMAEHDLLMSNMILDESETIYRSGLSPQTLRSYNLNIETAMVNLDQAKQDLLKTEILAPFDGTVVDIPVKVNDQLSQFDYSSKPVVHLVDTKTIKMIGTVDEVDISGVKVGQEATISVDAFPGRKVTGKVTFVSPFGNLTAGEVDFPIEIYLDPTEGLELKGTLTATADIVTGKRENVLMVPNRALRGPSGNLTVTVVLDPDKGITEQRRVTIGLQTKSSTEIISGLKEGEKVLIQD